MIATVAETATDQTEVEVAEVVVPSSAMNAANEAISLEIAVIDVALDGTVSIEIEMVAVDVMAVIAIDATGVVTEETREVIREVILEVIREDIQSIRIIAIVVLHEAVTVVRQNQDQDRQVTAETVIVIMVLKWKIVITNKFNFNKKLSSILFNSLLNQLQLYFLKAKELCFFLFFLYQVK